MPETQLYQATRPGYDLNDCRIAEMAAHEVAMHIMAEHREGVTLLSFDRSQPVPLLTVIGSGAMIAAMVAAFDDARCLDIERTRAETYLPSARYHERFAAKMQDIEMCIGATIGHYLRDPSQFPDVTQLMERSGESWLAWYVRPAADAAAAEV